MSSLKKQTTLNIVLTSEVVGEFKNKIVFSVKSCRTSYQT